MVCDAKSVKKMFKKNAGKYFEDWIDWANKQYLDRGLAVVNKIPTPWKVQRKYSPYKKTYEIANAFPEAKSTVDFGGTANSCSIWFDAKVTKNKTSFPLVNIHKHQIDYLKNVHNQGGKAFLLIHSEHLKSTWLLWIDQLLNFMEHETRKSIPFTWFNDNCSLIKSKNGIVLHYLEEALHREKGTH
jgi:recombination protein U